MLADFKMKASNPTSKICYYFCSPIVIAVAGKEHKKSHRIYSRMYLLTKKLLTIEFIPPTFRKPIPSEGSWDKSVQV